MKIFTKWFVLSLFAFTLLTYTFVHAKFAFEEDLHPERLGLLKKNGFSPKVIYDIGAYRGYWTMDVKEVFPQAQFFLFEANQEHKPYLDKTSFPYFNVVLGDKDQTVTFYSNCSTGDSVYREQTKYYQESQCNEKQLQMTTLASVVQKNKLPLPDLIKIDVQGAEKLIIQGSPEIITHAEVIIMETKILEYNKGAPLIHEMMTMMNGLGYSLTDILECHYLPSGELNEVDCLFVKKGSKYIKQGLLIK